MKIAARDLLTSPWLLHCACCLLTLAGSAAILFPLHQEKEIQEIIDHYAGILILGSILTSFLLMLGSAAYYFLRMRNYRALGQIAAWGLQWCATAGLFSLIAIRADVPPPYEIAAPPPIQTTDTLHTPSEQLTGPTTLVIPIDPELSDETTVANIPNLRLLGEQNADILNQYLTRLPRWAYATPEDTFYTYPGHVVLSPPATGGIPGHVHCVFRSLTSGAKLPAGYSVIKPGESFPKMETGKTAIPDMALEIDARRFLLLAWRGPQHAPTAYKAINAAIAAIDARMQTLAESPTEETIQQLLNGKRTATGNAPELRVSEPPSQYGIYQAEIYANPGRPGAIRLTIRDMETRQILQTFTCPALYSDDSHELFRYDIPGSATERTGQETAGLFPEGAPFFAIRTGTPHEYFGVAFEADFLPEDGSQATRLLRRCYKVQAYEKQLPPPPQEQQENEETSI